MAKSKKTSIVHKPKVPPIIYSEASVRSIGGRSLFEEGVIVNSNTVVNYSSESQLIQEAIDKLQIEGFTIHGVGESTITIAGSKSTYEKAFKTKIHAEERSAMKSLNGDKMATFLECPDTSVPGLIETRNTIFEDIIEGVSINEPVYFFSKRESPFPPNVDYWHLNVPGGISLATNADKAHRIGITGKGVKVVMVDSGWYRHSYFTQRGYRFSPVALGPAASNPENDESGHGTGESANIFAIAPDVNFQMVKINFINSVGAFNAAVALNPDIITCSWGSSRRDPPLSSANQSLAAAISNAVRRGITVVFSAGNGHWGFPGQHPDVISAGGVFRKEDGVLQASDYSSGFASRIYQGRLVPDVSGLVGMQPGARYIMLPVEPGDNIDINHSGGNHPNGDETARDDGWAAFSGTSAAAPQVAGTCALIKQVCRNLSPTDVKDILKRTALDITEGKCHPNTGGNNATNGPDLATGRGLINAYRASMIARLRNALRPPRTNSSLPTSQPNFGVHRPPLPNPLLEEFGDEEYKSLEDFLLGEI